MSNQYLADTQSVHNVIHQGCNPFTPSQSPTPSNHSSNYDAARPQRGYRSSAPSPSPERCGNFSFDDAGYRQSGYQLYGLPPSLAPTDYSCDYVDLRHQRGYRSSAPSPSPERCDYLDSGIPQSRTDYPPFVTSASPTPSGSSFDYDMTQPQRGYRSSAPSPSPALSPVPSPWSSLPRHYQPLPDPQSTPKARRNNGHAQFLTHRSLTGNGAVDSMQPTAPRI